MKNFLIVLSALILIVGTSCVSHHDQETDREALIKLTSTGWDANMLAGNVDACVDSYTEDAVRIQDGQILKGKEEIRTILTSFRPGFSIASAENEAIDVRISGDLATVRGRFTGSWASEEWGDTLWTVGTWVDICERQEDGSWKMVYTMASELR